MTDAELGDYVDAACVLQGVVLTADERVRVILQFGRIAAVAEPVLALELPTDIEAPPGFRP